MPHTLHFPGWNRPVLDVAVDTLFTFADTETLDLSHLTCVVPTRNAARRLREKLAQHAAKTHRAVLPGPIVQPQFFLAPPPATTTPPTANIAEQFAAWMHILRTTPETTVQTLFPKLHAPEKRREQWLITTAHRLITLRTELAENGHTLKSAGDIISEQNEPQRWHELGTLEQAYLALLKSHDRTDPEIAKIHQAKTPRLPENSNTLVIIATPDPIPLAVEAWKQLAATHTTHVVVHAPESLRNAFDEWGRPKPQNWHHHHLHIPHADTNLLVRQNPADQARFTRDLFQNHSIAPTTVAIGAPSPDLGDAMEKELQRIGLDTFNPAGIPITQTAVASFTLQFAKFAKSQAFNAAAECLRHPDFLNFLHRAAPEVATEDILRELSTCAGDHLPQTFAELLEHASAFPALARACTHLEQIARPKSNQSPGDHLRTTLSTIYDARHLKSGNPNDDAFETAAKEIRQLIDWLDDSVCRTWLKTPQATFAVLEKLLETRTAYADRDPNAIDILGWLELHWEDAPTLVLGDMNDGVVPESFTADLFLPEQARKQLGLHDNDSRFARDAYLLAAMIEQRRESGTTLLLTGKFNATNDPEKPSRLLFLCPDSDLPGRARKLFGELEAHDQPVPRSVTWKLTPPKLPVPKRVSVTALKNYLACPFRFYLETVLGMNEIDVRKTEMDALDYGTLAHTALETLSLTPSLLDVDQIQALLIETLRQKIVEKYGKNLSAPLRIQRHSLEQRLTALAKREAQIRADGWKTILSEQKMTLELAGLTISGKIDRVDQRDNCYRVIDYKSSDSTQNPARQLLGSIHENTPDYARIMDENNKEKAWRDLQLPVYTLMLRREFPNAESIHAGYFNLPKAVTETGLVLWDNVSEALLDSAKTCVLGIARDIGNGRFWPPTHTVKFDRFTHILFDQPQQYVDEHTELGLPQGG